MFVCLCNGVTTQTVTEAVSCGASTTKEVAQACGAGADCGRCRRTVRAIIAAAAQVNASAACWSPGGDVEQGNVPAACRPSDLLTVSIDQDQIPRA